VDAAVDALVENAFGQIFVKAGILVRVTREGKKVAGYKRVPEAPLIGPLPEPRLLELLSAAAQWFRLGQDGWDRALPPKWAVQVLAARGRWPFAGLELVAESPTLRPDGTVRPRENPESDWILVPGTHEPLIPPPTFDRAQELMRGRARNVGPRNGRAGSGLRSPYLLSGLVTCARCGQAYQGRTINSTKYRKDGSKIKTLYYACGGWVMKGASACEKFLIRKEPLEDLLMETIQRLLDNRTSYGTRGPQHYTKAWLCSRRFGWTPSHSNLSSYPVALKTALT
jgi:hypothetical protein